MPPAAGRQTEDHPDKSRALKSPSGVIIINEHTTVQRIETCLDQCT
jgi:hypothetical protein